jgi:hypothetical protein
MGKFFESNPAFEKSYYTYEANILTTVDATETPDATSKHIIKPTQAFFLKCAISSVPENIVFNTDMMTDGNFEVGTKYDDGGSGARALNRFTLKASNGSGASSASVNLSDEASADYVNGEDVTTLFDSNLDGVPMVFTVAGEKAVSIDRRPALDMVPFGVACGSSSEMVQLTVDGGSWMADGQLYVLDAVTGSVTEVGMEKIFAVQPNDYGRYFLTSTKASPLTLSHGEGADVLISVRGKQVTVTASAALQQVRAFSVSGATVYQTSHPGTTCQFQLQQGTYVVETETLDGRKTVKVLVK